jgi:Virulence-associated protein E
MDNDPKNDRADYAAIKARLAEDAKRLGIDPDEEDLRARANIRRLDETPAFQQKSDDDMSPDVERIKKLMDNPDLQQKADTGAPKDKAQTKIDKEDRLIQNYISHLNLVVNWGGYNEFLDAKEIIKMAQIKSHMAVSKHPQIPEVQALYNKIVTIIRTRYSAPDVERWFKAVNDEIADSKARNNQNALKCPIISWSDVTSGGKPKEKILCAIVAVRSLLEEKKLQLRNDIWKSYSVITDEKGVEKYQSRQTDSILREWRNYIYERKTTMYSMDVIKDAYHQIAKDNEFHSLQEKIRAVEWDGQDRFASGAQAFGLKLTGEGEDINFTVRVFRQHLMASMARVFHPGVWYDLVLCTFGAQGAGKTTGLRILYGRDNIISCNFFELDPKVQSEKTRNGVAAVENADTFGDARKADFNRIKADVSTDSYLGRDAYGKVEDMRRVNITYVIWYTGNELKVLRDPTGNRRFIIVYSERAIDEDWLRLNSGQLWAQSYAEMEKLRGEYLEEMKRKGIAEEYPKYLELPHDLWAEAEGRQNASMVDGVSGNIGCQKSSSKTS